jgi:ssRNA-specific RNase YbeY (16S rRNA maturation enzyme)
MNINVPIYIESRYKVNRKKIKEIVKKTLDTNGMKGEVEVSVAIVGDRKMKSLNKKYRDLDKSTNVLSFSRRQAMPGRCGCILSQSHRRSIA